MTRFCLLLLVCVFSLRGFCQEFVMSDGEQSVSSSNEILLSKKSADRSNDLQTFTLPDVPVDGFSEEASIELESDQLEAPSIMKFDYKDSKYWGRYTALRTAGWITFGAGMGFFIGGYAMILGAWACDSDAADGLGVAGSLMLISAPVLVLTSIPLLSCAYYNRHKAKKMYLSVGTSYIPSDKMSPFKASTPALNLAVTF